MALQSPFANLIKRLKDTHPEHQEMLDKIPGLLPNPEKWHTFLQEQESNKEAKWVIYEFLLNIFAFQAQQFSPKVREQINNYQKTKNPLYLLGIPTRIAIMPTGAMPLTRFWSIVEERTRFLSTANFIDIPQSSALIVALRDQYGLNLSQYELTSKHLQRRASKQKVAFETSINSGLSVLSLVDRASALKILLAFASDKKTMLEEEEYQLFVMACKNGFTEIVELFLEQYPSEHLRTALTARNYGEVLSIASAGGHAEIVELLLWLYTTNSIDIREVFKLTENYGLKWACKGGHVAVAKLLLAYYDQNPPEEKGFSKEYYYAWQEACDSGSKGILELLVKIYSPENLKHALEMDTCKSFFNALKHEELVPWLLSLYEENSGDIEFVFIRAFHHACMRNRPSLLRILFEYTNNSKIIDKKSMGLEKMLSCCCKGDHIAILDLGLPFVETVDSDFTETIKILIKEMFFVFLDNNPDVKSKSNRADWIVAFEKYLDNIKVNQNGKVIIRTALVHLDAYLDQATAEGFATTVFISDDYLESDSEKTTNPAHHAWNVAKKLPDELQRVFWIRFFGKSGNTIHNELIEPAFQTVARAYPQSPTPKSSFKVH